MGIPYFFHSPLAMGSLRLSAEESKHAGGSRRLRPGQALVLVDGRGGAAEARVVWRQDDRLEVCVDHIEQRPRPPLARLTLATAMPKGRRQGFLFEKCAELGVGKVVATTFRRSVTGTTASKLDRWSYACREAIKQSKQAWLPVVEACGSTDQLIARVPDGSQRFWATTGRGAPTISRMKSSLPHDADVFAVIGPEGGLCDEECTELTDAGFMPISLGPSVLRIESACVVLAAQLLALDG
ncbi:MAG: 16S rRNA (uracil(1498)-N(3))-methyltransferase [Phycisphaerales bacterium]|nr:MAG: 16S rRNA (uracil(1498)-N(3))-methyltransferase [Phycisphaerales bacterium]